MTDSAPETMESLVEKALAGDRQAFSVIVRQLMTRVTALTYRMTGDMEIAKELAQDTFVSAWENLRTYRGDAGFANWVFRIATNKSLNHLRSAARHGTESGSTLDDLESSAPDPERQLNRRELADRVREFMSGLPPQQRAIFELRFYKQMPFEQIAEALDRAVGTVKTGYREAVIKLRAHALEKGWQV
ncbi:MAG: sigma-70 family RNA polymerase sigma factor [Candidatus Zixiibacteriota bacterium]